MHEIYLAQELLNIIDKEVAQRNLPDIRQVSVTLGAFSNVAPDSLTFCFDQLKSQENTYCKAMRNAVLVFNHLPGQGHCQSCGAEFTLDKPWLTCPFCGKSAVEITQGYEFALEYIDTED